MDQFSNEPLSDDAAAEAARDRLMSRDSLFLMADLRVVGTTDATSVRVRNLSAGGLMAEFPLGLEQGLAVECEIRGLGWVRGHVAWSAAGRIGVAFERQIDPKMARKPVGSGSGRSPAQVSPLYPQRR